MAKKNTAVLAILILLAVLPRAIQAQDAKTILSNAAKAMGAENLKTIQYTGSGSNAGIGQNKHPNAAWPLVRVKTYTREIDLNTPSSRVQMVRIQNGAEQTPNQIILPATSWNTQSNIW